jgi:hypothetical protein
MVGGYSGLPIGDQPHKTLIARRRSRSFSYVLSQEWRFDSAPATAICRNSQILDAADVVDLPGLIPPGDQAQIGDDVSGSADARRIVDRSYKGKSGHLAYAWNLVSAQHFGRPRESRQQSKLGTRLIGPEHASRLRLLAPAVDPSKL